MVRSLQAQAIGSLTCSVAGSAAQAWQMQARRRAAAGIRASACGLIRTSMHQQGAAASPSARGAACAQPFGPPHRGQSEVSMGGAGGGMG